MNREYCELYDGVHIVASYCRVQGIAAVPPVE